MANFINSAPYLRSSRQFPPDLDQLAIQVGRSYIDIANAVNLRTIGIFTTNVPTTTGEVWYITGNQRQQTLRQVYTFGAIAAGTELDIPLNIPSFIGFTKLYGEALNTNNQYIPLPYVDTTNVTNQIGLLVQTVTGVLSISIIVGATATPLVSGFVDLEYLSNV